VPYQRLIFPFPWLVHNKLLLSRFALGLPTLRFGSPKAKR